MTGKIARWTLLLQEFEFDIFHRPGVQHAIADYLSRLESGEVGDGVVAWLAQKRSVARTKDNVKVRKESPGFWTEETKRVEM